MTENLPVPEASWFIPLIQGTTAIPKSLAKLIDTIGEQIGLFLEPTHIRRKGQAEADVTVSEARAKAEVTVVQLQSRLAIQDIQDRAEERVKKRETKRQKNIEAITAQAVQDLPESVSEKPVDDDWVTQFFNHCQDISNEEMQSLWARLLAGEVAKPGSFSLRTLALVQVMSKDDANIFTRFCSLVWQTSNELTPIVPELEKVRSLVGVQLGFIDFVRLDSLGLIRLAEMTTFRLLFTNDPHLVFYYYGRQHTLTKPGARELSIGKAILTEAGKELAVIAGSPPNEEYRIWITSTLRESGWEVVET